MLQRVLFCLIALPCCLAASLQAAGIVLADHGQSDYRIVIADSSSQSTKYAAAELQMFFAQISGARLPISNNREVMADHEIVLGQSRHLEKLAPGIDFKSLAWKCSRSPWASDSTRTRRWPGWPLRKAWLPQRTICSCPASTFGLA